MYIISQTTNTKITFSYVRIKLCHVIVCMSNCDLKINFKPFVLFEIEILNNVKGNGTKNEMKENDNEGGE